MRVGEMKLLVAVMAAAALSACSPLKDKPVVEPVKPQAVIKTEPTPPVQDEPAATEPAVSGKPEVIPMAQDVAARELAKHPFDDPTSLLFTRVVYFDFDSSALKEEGRKVLGAHAEYLAKNPSAKVSIEGHTDERGTREYNMALGDRRALSVKQTLQLLGAKPSQLETVSYGEEQAADLGHDEAAWAKNRRAELNYLSR